MKPKKVRHLYQEYSEENNISKDLAEDLIDFYYRNVRTLLSELHHPRINITGLGLFTAREGAVKRAIPRVKKYLKNHDTSTYSAYYNMKMLEKKLACLEYMQDQINSEKKRKENFKKNKNESKKNLGK